MDLLPACVAAQLDRDTPQISVSAAGLVIASLSYRPALH
jgi:hypothetical protein